MKRHKHTEQGQGWYEKPSPITNLAPRHVEVSNRQTMKREGFINNSHVTITPTNDMEENVLKYEDSKRFLEFKDQFEKENNVKLPFDFENSHYEIEVPEKYVEEFKKFMEDNNLREINENWNA